jgi:hypothetical protein
MASQARPRECRTVSPSHQVRRWRSCYPWTTLAPLAHAFPVVAAVTNTLASKHLSGWSRRPAPRFSICSRRCWLGRSVTSAPVALVGLAAPTAGTRPQLPPGDRAAPIARAWRPASLGLPLRAGYPGRRVLPFNLGFQLFYLADSEAVPAELLSTGLELLLRPLLEPGPTRPQDPRRPGRPPWPWPSSASEARAGRGVRCGHGLR